MLPTPQKEITAVRLYSKTPGTDRLRKSAESELRTMIAAGWLETQRTINADHVLLRMERPLAKPLRLGNGASGAGGRQGR